MPYIMMTPSVNKLEPAVKKKAFAFLEKLGESDATPGLHIEPLHNVVDSRVRTGRVDIDYRAVLFKVQGSGDDAHYVFIGVWKHDDAIAVAKKTRLTINPVNGVAELIRESEPEPTPDPVTPVPDPIGVVEPVATEPLPVLQGYSLDDLVNVLGIEESVAKQALAAPDSAALNVVAERAAERALWQGLAILELLTGFSVARIKRDLALDDYEPELVENEDDRLLEALTHPAAQISFTIVDDEALRRAIDDGDFSEWRVFLHPEQRRYVDRDTTGPFRLSGGAGTGKTVVLLHRAQRLAKRDPTARIVLTTYTTNLAEALKTDLRRLAPEIPLAAAPGEPGVFVAGVDSLAGAVLRASGSDIAADVETVLGQRTADVTVRPGSDDMKDAMEDTPTLSPDLRSVNFLETEYALVILPNRITTREQYLKVRRPGRGVKLDRARRSAVWDVIEAYRRRGRMAEKADFEEVVAIAAASAERRRAEGLPSLADHVLVDEGQDLTPSRWKLLRALPGEGPNDLFIAEDSQQRIYGHRVVLGHYGIRIVGRSQRLTLNYRTTAQNLAYAVGLLEGTPFVDLEELDEDIAGYRSSRRGPVPRALPAASPEEEWSNAATLIQEWLNADGAPAPETMAILVRDKWVRDTVARVLAERKVTVRPVDRGAIKPGQPLVMTMNRAKGMEFTNVLLFGLSDRAEPKAFRDLPEAERVDARLRERSLLYVAATRARDQLAYSWSGTPSPLLRMP
ncbi:UvrD-helicase domain-containing protein [Rathayibacter sp. AY1H3]|uniref:UvrD-helicase domain-containing protein n=1 Tax=Rathayibacter sp. AY1H3 TaxID=2080567 RepID=UPI000CE83B22|nr:UvrD-helicase domain-containing protein [Rathayibacter sp. AY1H3]PPH07611.1 DNA helicase UvrD [Rathayibacter sp. AY1H3]